MFTSYGAVSWSDRMLAGITSDGLCSHLPIPNIALALSSVPLHLCSCCCALKRYCFLSSAVLWWWNRQRSDSFMSKMPIKRTPDSLFVITSSRHLKFSESWLRGVALHVNIPASCPSHDFNLWTCVNSIQTFFYSDYLSKWLIFFFLLFVLAGKKHYLIGVRRIFWHGAQETGQSRYLIFHARSV